MTKPKGKVLSECVAVYLTPQEMRDLEKFAYKEFRSLSGTARKLIMEGIREQQGVYADG